MRFSEAKNRKVVSSSTAATIGKVKSFVVDPATRSVVAVRLKKSEAGDILRWSDMTAFGTDAVTVTAPDKLVEQDEGVDALTGKAHEVLGKRVLSSAGDELGEVADIDFDPTTGGVVSILVKGNDAVEGARLIGIGAYAVVVRGEPA